VKLQAAQASREATKDLQVQLSEELAEGRPIKEIIANLKDGAARHEIQETELVGLVSILSNK